MVVALVIAVSLAVTRPWASTKDRDDVAAPAPGDRVLQSVNVVMNGDGTLTRVGDTVVIARADEGAADTYSTTYDPSKVVDQLPVRVLTAYRTDKGSGTDLDDLKGFSGRVTIDLTVQNLTVAPQQVTYDVAGRSQTTTALVGAPLTVVASAALPGIDPATVVTAAADAIDTTGTNGVLSQASDGTAQVQWASILAPPQLDSTAILRLVVDAKDFVVPTVDLSVQPGLVTDPSVGALIDTAFNPKNSNELELETRTIALVGDVNDVLGRASGTVSGLRKTLDSSAKTLGTKTVESLTQNTKTVSTSLKRSSSDIESLGDDLEKSLETTQSTTLQRMSETVSQLQDVIGDTSVPEPKVTVTGTGCAATVTASGSEDGVYANLLRVIAQLDAFESTTDGCKREVQAAISAAIGTTDQVCATTADPAVEPNTKSVVCSLRDAQGVFGEVSASIGTSQTASDKLDPEALGPVQTEVALRVTQLNKIAADTRTLLLDKPADDDVALAKVTLALTSAGGSLGDADTSLTALTGAINNVHNQAQTNRTRITSMIAQNAEVASGLCAVLGDGTQPGKLTSQQVEALRSYLVTRSCPGLDGSTDELTPPVGFDAAMSTRLAGQATAWSEIADTTETADTEQGLGLRLAELKTSLGDLRTHVEEAGAELDKNREALVALAGSEAKAQSDLAELGTSIDGVIEGYSQAKSDLDTALAHAAELSGTAATDSLNPAIKQVVEQGNASTQSLGQAFDSSVKGLGAAADALRDGTAKTLKNQQDDLDDQAKDDEAALKSQTSAGLSQIAGSVKSATRDIDSTRTSLTKDLNNVLLDLGDPKVPGTGLLGTLAKSARSAGSADFQLGLASDTVSAYAAVRSQEVEGILLRQAQAEASLQRQAELPAFATDLEATTQHRTVYLFHLGGDR